MFQKLTQLFFSAFFVWAAPQGLQAQVDPDIEWREIETADAYWLFDAKHQQVAQYYISQFQRAKQPVESLFSEKSRKMTILLIDNTDLANGSAQVTPHPIIVLYLVNPSANSGIGEFENQIRELLVHEYTHILNMEPVNGWIRPFSWIFGTTAHPNMMLPRWYTEGLAVYTESALSENGGRLASQHLQALARSLTLDEAWPQFPLSQLNDYHPDALGGSRAYLFGGILWESLAREGGTEIIDRMNQSFSRRIPFLLNGVAEAQRGHDFDEQLKRAYDFWALRSREQLEKIGSQPILSGQKLDRAPASSEHSPRISPDGLWMLSLMNDRLGSGHVRARLRHPKKGFSGYQAKTLVANTGSQSLEWHPTGSGFLYEKIDRVHRYYRFYDLFYYDMRSGQSRRVTLGARAHHACFSPSGDKLYYLTNKPAGKDIVAMDWPSGQPEVIYQSGLGEDLRYLSCSNPEQILFIEQKPGESPHLASLRLADRSRHVLFDQAPVRFLKSTHLGLLIGSDQSGVENLYLLRPGRKIRLESITNTLTRTLQADIDPLDDQLYYAQADRSGSGLYQMEGAQWESLPDTPPKVEPLFKSQFKEGVTTSPEAADASVSLPSRSFRPWRYLYPNHWIPFMYLVDGGQLYQALTSAGDPMGIHQINLLGQWDTLTRKPGASLSYQNNSLPVSLGGAVSDIYNYFFNSRTTLHFTNLQVVSSYTFDTRQLARLLFRWKYSSLDVERSTTPGRDFLIRQGPQLEFSFADLKRTPDDISISSGYRFELGHREFLPSLGNVEYGETYSHFGTFWSSFTPKRHVFYLGLNGSYAPQLNNAFFATSTLAGPFLNPQITNTSFLQRGYPTGVFVARNIANINAEYRFPMGSIFRGFTTPPLFFKNLQGSLILDASSLDGIYSNSVLRASERTEFGSWFTGYGVEFESNLQVGFHVPITLTLGFYYGQQEQAFGGFNTFFNIRL